MFPITFFIEKFVLVIHATEIIIPMSGNQKPMCNLKTPFLLTAVIAVISLSCSKENKLPNPIQEIINQDKNCICLTGVDTYKWKSGLVYYVRYSITCCGGPITYFYNENGEPIQKPEWSSLEQFFDESELIKNIYTCKDAKNNP